MRDRSGLDREDILSVVPHLIVVSYAASVLVHSVWDPLTSDRVSSLCFENASWKECCLENGKPELDGDAAFVVRSGRNNVQ